jgi:hypothetical protein
MQVISTNEDPNMSPEDRKVLERQREFMKNHFEAIDAGKGKPITNPRLEGHALGIDDWPPALDPKTNLVVTTQLTGEAYRLLDLAIVAGVSGALIDGLKTHSRALARLRDQIHNPSLSDSDLPQRRDS